MVPVNVFSPRSLLLFSFATSEIPFLNELKQKETKRNNSPVAHFNLQTVTAGEWVVVENEPGGRGVYV